MIKKRAVVLAALIVVFIFGAFGCSDMNVDKGLSQIRTDVYTAETKEFSITAYAERREIPLIPDGKAGETFNVIVVKVCSFSLLSGTYSFTAIINDGEYTSVAEQRAGNIMRADIPVDELPSGEFVIKITGEKSEEVELKSSLPDGMAGYSVAVETVRKQLYAEGITQKNQIDGEMFVRVLVEGEQAYWYVGYVTEEKTYSFLLNADGKEIVARKTDETKCG